MPERSIYTVVVADDEQELLDSVCEMIPWEALGFHLVGRAGNGLDALELVERLEPALYFGHRAGPPGAGNPPLHAHRVFERL